MNRYLWPTFKRPADSHPIIGSRVRIRPEAIAEWARENAYLNRPSTEPLSWDGVLVNISDGRAFPYQVKHDIEGATRGWRLDNIEILP